MPHGARGYGYRDSKELPVGDGIFRYEVVGENYVMITGYRSRGGALTFTGGLCFIDVPETIDGLPVLKIAPMSLDLKLWMEPGDGQYAHNGSSRVIIRAPEYTSFEGLLHTRIDCYSVFTPSHRLRYYPRTQAFLTETRDGVTFLAKALPSDTCTLIFLSTGHTELQDNVWDPIPRKDRVEIRIPETIGGLKVTTVAEGASLGLYAEAPVKIVFPDSVETIEDDNFNGLPFLEEVRFGRGLRRVGKYTFDFYENNDEEVLKKVPPLKVFHYGAPPAQTETEFSRGALAEEYEDYSDWGWMRVGQHDACYPVEFIRLDGMEGD